jgi:hypothetical protein
MHTPKVIQFIDAFMKNEDFRFAVLHKEFDRMREFGLTDPQILTLQSLNAKDIQKLLLDETKAAGADVEAAFRMVNFGCDESGGPLGPQAMYEQGLIHVRCVTPFAAPAGSVQVALVAHGLAKNAQFQLRKDTATVSATIIEPPSVGDDLFQHVRIQANLTAGQWEILGRNPEEAGDFGDQTDMPAKTITIN